MVTLQEIERSDLALITAWRRDRAVVDSLEAPPFFVAPEADGSWYDAYLERRHGFQDRGLQRIQRRVLADNQRAIAAYESLGFARESLYKRAAFKLGPRVDVISMAAFPEGAEVKA